MEITKVYTQEIPATRFIGKKYGDSDRGNDGFGAQWGEAFEKGYFDIIEKAASTTRFFEDSDAYIGLMRFKEGDPFEYWVGMFVPADTAVPEGFQSVDFPEAKLGVAWYHGKEDELYGQESLAGQKLVEAGHKIAQMNGAYYFFERYGCPRFTQPDSDGKVILDIVHFLER